MLPARKWFVVNMKSFIEKKTMTPLVNGSHYNTVGRLVPKKSLQLAIKNIKIINI